MAIMVTLAERILDAIRFGPLDDDVLSQRLGVGHRQAVNQAARRLESQGRLQRFIGLDWKVVNALPDIIMQQKSEPGPVLRPPPLGGVPHGSRITEDEVKKAVRAHLNASVSKSLSRGTAFVGSTSTPGTTTAAATSSRLRPRSARTGLSRSATLPRHARRTCPTHGGPARLVRDRSACQPAVPRPGRPTSRAGRERLRLTVFWVSRQGDALLVDVDF